MAAGSMTRDTVKACQLRRELAGGTEPFSIQNLSVQALYPLLARGEAGKLLRYTKHRRRGRRGGEKVGVRGRLGSSWESSGVQNMACALAPSVAPHRTTISCLDISDNTNISLPTATAPRTSFLRLLTTVSLISRIH